MQREKVASIPAETADAALQTAAREANRAPVRLTVPTGLPLRLRLAAAADMSIRRVADAWEKEQRHGHLFYFVPVLIGLGAIVWFRVETEPAVAALVALFIACNGLAAFYAYRSTATFRLFAAAALVVAGMLFSALETRRMGTVIIDAPIVARLTGIVEQREQDGSGRWRYLVRVIGVDVPKMRRPPNRVALSVRARHIPFALGTRISARASFSPPAGPALPGLNDFAFAAYHAGIGANAFAFGAPTPLGTDPAAGLADGLARAIAETRSAITARIRTQIPGDTGAFAAAIITGEQRGLSREATEALRVSGLAHIVAVSGLNMALAAGLFFVGARRLLSLSLHAAHAQPIKKWAASGAILAAFGYFLISGSQVSAERAFIMTAIMLCAVLIDRPAFSMRNVALAALVILAMTPSQIVGPSFQMSFAATVALVAAYGGVTERSRRDEKPVMPALIPWMRPLLPAGKVLLGIAATSIVGGLSTAAFAAEHFQRLSGYALAANLAAMPLVSILVMPAAVIAMLAMPFGLDEWPFRIMAAGLDAVLWIAEEVASWGGSLEIARLPAWFLPLFVCGFLLAMLLGTWLRHAGTAVMVISLAAASLLPRQPPGELLVAENGSLVGLLHEGRIATNTPRPNAFIFDQWRRALGATAHDPPQSAKRTQTRTAKEHGKTAPAVDRAKASGAIGDAVAATPPLLPGPPQIGRFICPQKGLCLATSRAGWRIAAVEDPELVETACRGADILIAGPRIRRPRCGEEVRIIDRDSLRRTGALEISLPDRHTMAIRSAFSALTRPWHRHRLYDPARGRFADEAEALSDSGG